MTSSTITGERRWASSRRGGMTVLGKVAVPKPINLPSQKLENHGLDPNVEIVPKGTLSWGSRPSSAGSNAWGTSALSPSTDGSSSSSSHLVGRPSSGGGTRPSTAGSEKAHDSNVNVWNSNSRPSSASGVLASINASSTLLRPRSAETRPGSSQLSRFAESSTESSGAWGSSAKRIGSRNYGKDGFSLSSGDFPTLGSEKEESRTNMEPLDHASHRRPGSSSGVTMMKETVGIAHGDDISRNADFKGDYWRKDCSSYVEDGPRPSMERGYGQPYPCQNPNRAPPHYESWHGAQPFNPPDGVWYGGPPGPPPYGAPGGFAMEPFPYYGPQVPAPGLAHSQPLPPPGAGIHGHRPKHGDMYRPHMSESYIHPGMPTRPGFYPGPIPYEGYYRPPMGYCNPNERDPSFVGMATGSPGYNNLLNPNKHDPNNSHPRPGECGAPGQVEPCHPHDPRGNHDILRKQSDCWSQNDERKWSHQVTTSVSNREKGILSMPSAQGNAWGDDYKKDEDMHYGKNARVKQVPSQPCENKFGSLDPANLKPPANVNNVEDADIVPGIENAASSEDHTLIQKIEGLNAKARASGSRQDGFHMEDQHDRLQIVNAKGSRFANDATSNVAAERHSSAGVLAPVSHDTHIAAVDKSRETTASSTTAASRNLTSGAQSRGNHHRSDGFCRQEADRWRKRSEFPAVVSAGGSGSNFNDKVAKQYAVVHPAEVPKPNMVKGDGESVIPACDLSDAQRAKMKEIAKQRAIQLQKEEEERTREQKAKALAKLEELDRRSANQATVNPDHKMESVPPGNTAPHEQEDEKNQSEPRFDANVSAKSSLDTANSNTQTNERGSGHTLGSTVSSTHVGVEMKESACGDSVFSQNRLPIADVDFDDAASRRTVPQVREVSKQRRLGHKQRQNIHPEKSSTQGSIPDSITDNVKVLKDSGAVEEFNGGRVASGDGRELAESPHMFGPPVQHKKKNKNGKNKHKIEESSTAVSLSETAAKDSNHSEAISESTRQIASGSNIKSTYVQSTINAGNAARSESPSLSCEDAHGKQNAWKAQHSRKPRNPQGNRSSEKINSNNAVVWAPVPSHNKVEATAQTSSNNVESTAQSNHRTAEPQAASATGDNLVNNSPKAKRAEMERYVPKPVAKELALQGSIQQFPSPPVIQSATDGTAGIVKASQGSEYVVNAGSVVEPKHVDAKHRQRARGSWRQCVSAESVPVQASQDSSFATNTGKNFEKHNGSRQTIKSDGAGAPQCRTDEPSAKGAQIDASDGWNAAYDSGSSSSSAFAGAKDHVPSGRGKRLPFKGPKGSGSANNQNIDQKGSIPLKENRAVGDHSACHWQPKSQGYASQNQKGNRSQCSQNFIAEESNTLKRETGHTGDSHTSSQNSQGATRDPIACEDDDGGILSLGHRENYGGEVVPVRVHPHSSNLGSVCEVQSDPCGPVERDNEQRPSSGHRRNANSCDRFSTDHEPEGDWSSTSQENKQYSSPGNHERRSPNSHYGYQPVGTYNSSNRRSSNSGAPTESQPGGPRFHRRGQSNSRRGRGNLYGRQRGNPNDAGYEQ